MKMIGTRELATKSGKVMKVLEKEGFLVITKGGKPRSIMLPTSDETLVRDIQNLIYSGAAQAVARIQLKSQRLGLDRVPLTEIEMEIAATRKARKKNGGR